MRLPSLETNKLGAKSRLLQTHCVEAMPRLISDQYWPIADAEVNKDTLAKLLPVATELETRNGFKLYREGTAYDGSYFLVKPDGSSIVYYMEYLVHAAHFSGLHSVTQTSIWRKIGAGVPRGLASNVLFKYLVPRYPAVMSDKIQTTRGRDFWVEIMQEALAKNLTVELVDIIKNEVFPVKTEHDLDMWQQDKTPAWGWGERYEQLRFVIRK